MKKLICYGEYGNFETMIKNNYTVNDIYKKGCLLHGDKIEIYNNSVLEKTIEVINEMTNDYITIGEYSYCFMKLEINNKIEYYRKDEKDISNYKKVSKKEMIKK